MPRLRRILFYVFVAGTLVVTFTHLAGFASWTGVLPVQGPSLPDVVAASEDPLPPFRWEDIPIQYPISPLIPLPTGKPPKIPKIQYDFSRGIDSVPRKRTKRERLAAVKEAFEHSWNGYKEHAWLHDEVSPLSGGFKDTFGGWGATLVDSLDTLWIMGMKKEFDEAIKAIKTIDFTQSTLTDINVFETTIRYLGGFLSAYDLTNGKYPVLLDKAVEVGDMLYRAFDTPNHMPITRWKWKEYAQGLPQSVPASEVVAEVGSLTLEFTRLTQLTSDPKYYDVVQRVSDVFMREQNLTLIPGLWPLSVNPRDENMHVDNSFTLGGMADSVYEYLPKEYLLLSGRNEDYKTMHLTALDAVKNYLVFEPLLPPPVNLKSSPNHPGNAPQPKGPLILGTCRAGNDGVTLETRGEHLACFAGGMIALGARAMAPFQTPAQTAEDMDVARRLVKGCVWSYTSSPNGIGPELFYTYPCRKGRDAVTNGEETDWEYNNGDCTWTRRKWLENVKTKPKDEKDWEAHVRKNKIPEGVTSTPDPRYILRPEAIESVFMMYRMTGDMTWQDHAWRMFEHITAIAKTQVAFAAVPNVMDRDGPLSDSMESFWTAETLKYFYLIFAEEDVVSLDEYVFNTEAHPFRWRKSSWLTGV